MAPSLEQSAFDQPAINRNGVQKPININWDKLGFELTPTDYMYVMKCSKGDGFSQGRLEPYGNIQLSPSSGILNYGQGLFEGLKASKGENGEVMVFRPEENGARMKMGAERMCMPCPSVRQFVDAVKQTVVANKRWVPPPGKGSLYIRPLLMGTGPVLGLGPAPEYTFLIYASPVGSYHKDEALNLIVEESTSRAVPGGTGNIKTITNYANIYRAAGEAKARGFSDILFLDALTGKYIEEVSSCNIFIVKGNVISTPATTGTVLPGITRKSIIEIALDLGYEVEERLVSVAELMAAEEVFCTGTAVVVKPVASVTYGGTRVEYRGGYKAVSPIYDMLTGIQTGGIEDGKGWTVRI